LGGLLPVGIEPPT